MGTAEWGVGIMVEREVVEVVWQKIDGSDGILFGWFGWLFVWLFG